MLLNFNKVDSSHEQCNMQLCQATLNLTIKDFMQICLKHPPSSRIYEYIQLLSFERFDYDTEHVSSFNVKSILVHSHVIMYVHVLKSDLR